MKTISLIACFVLAFPGCVFAQTPVPTAAEPAGAPVTAAPAPVPMPVTAPRTGTKKIELQNGAWVEIDAGGTVRISQDGGKSWLAAMDGTWTPKDPIKGGLPFNTRGSKLAK